MSDALQKIHAERNRQIEVEGWNAEHDDQHDAGELLTAAGFYYRHGCNMQLTMRGDGAPMGWPWDALWWKPKSPERDLIRAGALCLAERARLHRKHGNAHAAAHVDHKLNLIGAALSALSEGTP